MFHCIACQQGVFRNGHVTKRYRQVKYGLSSLLPQQEALMNRLTSLRPQGIIITWYVTKECRQMKYGLSGISALTRSSDESFHFS